MPSVVYVVHQCPSPLRFRPKTEEDALSVVPQPLVSTRNTVQNVEAVCRTHPFRPISLALYMALYRKYPFDR